MQERTVSRIILASNIEIAWGGLEMEYCKYGATFVGYAGEAKGDRLKSPHRMIRDKQRSKL